MTPTLRTTALARAITLVIALAATIAPWPAAAQSADAVALAVLPLPETERATATVMSRSGEILRQGSGRFVCLTDAAEEEGFGVACYHESLEPYMARGRALAAAGVAGRASIERRWEEIDAGTLEMPDHPAALYQLFGDAAPAGGDVSGLQRLTVLYVAYQDAESLGLPQTPAGGLPWIMFPGRPTAHIMISGPPGG